MPAGFETPYPAWMARYTEEAGPFVMAYFGAQQHSLLPPDALAPVGAILARGPAPGHVLHARCHDGAGYDTRTAVAYWPDPAAFSAWRRESGFDAWWADPARESGPVGWFVEAVTPPAERLEVLYSTPDGIEGVGHLQAQLSEQPTTSARPPTLATTAGAATSSSPSPRASPRTSPSTPRSTRSSTATTIATFPATSGSAKTRPFARSFGSTGAGTRRSPRPSAMRASSAARSR